MEPSRVSTSRWEIHSHYKRDVSNFPLLSAETEKSLCRRWIDHHDVAAADQLVRSHLSLVVEIAMGYRRRGLPTEDLIGEGHVGLMRAVCRFSPDCGIRFAPYAAWWVQAAIQQHVLHNWSILKKGNSISQTRLFLNLHRVRGQSKAASR